MAYVVAVTWRAREGEEDRVRQILAEVVAHSRTEPGCRMFVGHRSLEDPRTFFLYEQYDDEAAFLAHRETEHFQQHVLGEAVPLLESRQGAFYEPLTQPE
jgi:quinol monooxygenase YgiN